MVTHCPILFRRDGDALRLAIHFAISNPHCKSVAEGRETVVIFPGPHCLQAYFSELVSKYEGAEGLPEAIMPQSMVGQLSSAILLFEIEVTDLEAKFKLGQNRSREDQDLIHRNLALAGNPEASALASFMIDFGGLQPRD